MFMPGRSKEGNTSDEASIARPGYQSRLQTRLKHWSSQARAGWSCMGPAWEAGVDEQCRAAVPEKGWEQALRWCSLQQEIAEW